MWGPQAEERNKERVGGWGWELLDSFHSTNFINSKRNSMTPKTVKYIQKYIGGVRRTSLTLEKVVQNKK